MAWYHWIATYMLILSAFVFWIVPNKNILFVATLIFIGLIALVMMRFLPPKNDDNYKPIPWPKPIKKFGRTIEIVLGWAFGIGFACLFIWGLFMDIFN